MQRLTKLIKLNGIHTNNTDADSSIIKYEFNVSILSKELEQKVYYKKGVYTQNQNLFFKHKSNKQNISIRKLKSFLYSLSLRFSTA